jgi:hypothetical protein
LAGDIGSIVDLFGTGCKMIVRLLRDTPGHIVRLPEFDDEYCIQTMGTASVALWESIGVGFQCSHFGHYIVDDSCSNRLELSFGVLTLVDRDWIEIRPTFCPAGLENDGLVDQLWVGNDPVSCPAVFGGYLFSWLTSPLLCCVATYFLCNNGVPIQLSLRAKCRSTRRWLSNVSTMTAVGTIGVVSALVWACMLKPHSSSKD